MCPHRSSVAWRGVAWSGVERRGGVLKVAVIGPRYRRAVQLLRFNEPRSAIVCNKGFSISQPGGNVSRSFKVTSGGGCRRRVGDSLIIFWPPSTKPESGRKRNGLKVKLMIFLCPQSETPTKDFSRRNRTQPLLAGGGTVCLGWASRSRGV